MSRPADLGNRARSSGAARARRRLYLMRHAEVAYFRSDGSPVRPDEVELTADGEAQAASAGRALADVELDRVLTSGLPRTDATARIVAPGHDAEAWPEFRELQGGRLDAIADDELEEAFVAAFRGVVPEQARFLGGESIGELFDRVLPALDRLLAAKWRTVLAVLHGGVNRAILSYALTGNRTFLGGFEQAPACINIVDIGERDWIVRAVGYAPYDALQLSGRSTTMERLYAEYLPYRTRRR
jgi:broad specificity phosphatase PhoE